mmetsp:Transcript_1695/g.2100  ORF Transcript_1695/g.2100 Transcript_1695/m.2100 type:complete len:83 (-) Transcript_1695:175-423(-)
MIARDAPRSSIAPDSGDIPMPFQAQHQFWAWSLPGALALWLAHEAGHHNRAPEEVQQAMVSLFDKTRRAEAYQWTRAPQRLT